MTPAEFLNKWRNVELKERSAAQERFLDLCRLVAHPTPAEADPAGGTFCFEKGTAKLDGGDGCADVWKRGHFAFEYKGRHLSEKEWCYPDPTSAHNKPKELRADMSEKGSLKCATCKNLMQERLGIRSREEPAARAEITHLENLIQQ